MNNEDHNFIQSDKSLKPVVASEQSKTTKFRVTRSVSYWSVIRNKSVSYDESFVSFLKDHWPITF